MNNAQLIGKHILSIGTGRRDVAVCISFLIRILDILSLNFLVDVFRAHPQSFQPNNEILPVNGQQP